MNALQAAARYERLRAEPLWRLLAADLGPVVMAVLQGQLLGEARSVPGSVLCERIDRDLEALRSKGHDLPRAAKAYLTDWLAAGYISRRFPPGAAEEEYELSTAAANAIRFVESLEERRAVATESRLSIVIQQLVRLAEETETRPEARLAALEAERARIDREIEAVRGGHVGILPEERALERIREAIDLADGLVGDFRRVRDEFDGLNRDLRERVMDSEGSRGDVLEKVFEGVDLIAESEAGRTFSAFWRLLTDPEEGAALEEALEKVLTRDFAAKMDSRERRFLLRLMTMLLNQGGMVHEVLQHFARSLKQFVQSREYLEQRRINGLIVDAQRAALALKDTVKPATALGMDLRLTTGRMRSVDQWVLYDPSANTIEKGVAPGDAALVDLDTIGALVAQSEIDFRALRANIAEALADRATVSVGELLERFPAEQGLGSVVGYLALGSRHGLREDAQGETVSWQGEDEAWRSARIPTVYFLRERLHELG